MVGLDTNVLVRWLLADETAGHQSALAAQVIGGAVEEVMIGHVVLAEFSWVAERVFGLGRKVVADLLRSILAGPMIVVPMRGAVEVAIDGFTLGGPGFADHLIAALNRDNGCRSTYTFDKVAGKAAHFTLLQ